jgi:hypothetical protein
VVREVELEDGTKPVMVPTRTPGLSANRHRNSAMAAAGRWLFEAAVEQPGEDVGRNTPRVAINPDDPAANQLLVDVMDGEVRGREDLRRRLLEIVYLFAQGGSSNDTIRYSGSLAPRYYTAKYGSHVRSWSPREASEAMARLGSWLNVYLNNAHRPEMLRPRPCDEADKTLYEYARRQQEAEPSWTASTIVHGKRWTEVPVVNGYEKEQQLKYLRQTVAVMGPRLCALLILCEGLAADPILVESGQQEVRMRKTLVVHHKQPEHDAQLELARKLVNPSEDPDEYLAHVRLAGGRYHEVELVKPVSGAMNFAQLEEVRSRSRSLYAVVSPQDESADTDEPPGDEPPAIGRRSPKR